MTARRILWRALTGIARMKSVNLSSKDLPLSALRDMVEVFAYDVSNIYERDILDTLIHSDRYCFLVSDQGYFCISDDMLEDLDLLPEDLQGLDPEAINEHDWFSFVDLFVIMESSFLYMLSRLTERMKYLDSYDVSDTYTIIKGKLV